MSLKYLIAQLPSLLEPGLCALPLGPDKLITRVTFEQEIVQQFGVEPSRAAAPRLIAGRLRLRHC